MVALLNLLPTALLLVGLALAWRWRKWWPALLAVALWLTYATLQPSYMPKEQMQREAVPPPQQSDAPLQDRLSKPDSLEERDERIRRAVQEGLEFTP